MTEIKPDGGELEPQDPSLNPNGDEIIEDEDLDFLDEEEKEREQEALEIFNKRTGKNYKSWEDVTKSEKQRDVEFAQRPKPKMEEPKPSFKNSKRLLIAAEPDAKFIIDEIMEKHPNEDPYDVWEESEYYRKEAAVRASKERAKTRISNPTGVDGVGQDSEEQRMAQKFMKNFPPGIPVPKLTK